MLRSFVAGVTVAANTEVATPHGLGQIPDAVAIMWGPVPAITAVTLPLCLSNATAAAGMNSVQVFTSSGQVAASAFMVLSIFFDGRRY